MDHGDPECCGTIWPVPREGEDVVDFCCNECDSLIKTVPTSDVSATIEAMREDKGEGVWCECPHCGEVNEFPGYEKMFAYICRKCGRSVGIAEFGKNDDSVN
jgi:hypothetical protein